MTDGQRGRGSVVNAPRAATTSLPSSRLPYPITEGCAHCSRTGLVEVMIFPKLFPFFTTRRTHERNVCVLHRLPGRRGIKRSICKAPSMVLSGSKRAAVTERSRKASTPILSTDTATQSDTTIRQQPLSAYISVPTLGGEGVLLSGQ